MDNIYLTERAEVLGVRKHTPIEWSFSLATDMGGVPGQFVMVSFPGAGGYYGGGSRRGV